MVHSVRFELCVNGYSVEFSLSSPNTVRDSHFISVALPVFLAAVYHHVTTQ